MTSAADDNQETDRNPELPEQDPIDEMEQGAEEDRESTSRNPARAALRRFVQQHLWDQG